MGGCGSPQVRAVLALPAPREGCAQLLGQAVQWVLPRRGVHTFTDTQQQVRIRLCSSDSRTESSSSSCCPFPSMMREPIAFPMSANDGAAAAKRSSEQCEGEAGSPKQGCSLQCGGLPGLELWWEPLELTAGPRLL